VRMKESYVTRLKVVFSLSTSSVRSDVRVYYLADLQDGVNKLIDLSRYAPIAVGKQKVRPKSSVQ